MNFKQIETFINVVEWDSFSEAAKKLYLTQPTVSTHIRQLESDLNIRLISRTTKSLTLTEEGKEFYRYAKSISRIVESMEDAFSQNRNDILTIGCSSVPSNYILPEVLKDEKIRNSFSKINITLGDSQSTIDGVINGEFNIGIVGNTSMNRDLKFEKILSDKMVIVAPATKEFLDLKTNGATVSDLLKYPILVREQGSGTRKESLKLLEALGISKNSLNIAARINDAETIKKYVKLSMGITLSSELSIREEVEKGELLSFHLTEIDSTRDFYFVYRNNFILSKPLQNLIKAIKKQFKTRE